LGDSLITDPEAIEQPMQEPECQVDEKDMYFHDEDHETMLDEEPVDDKNQYNMRSKSYATNVSIAHVMHISVKKAIDMHGDTAIKVLKAELQQMVEKDVWKPVKADDIYSKDEKREKGSIIRSFVFFKEKYLPDGKFDKLKARLVAGGHMENRELYGDISSPTVSLTAVMMVLTIAAKEARHIAALDIAGAYLNAAMNNKEIYMIIEPSLAKMLESMYPKVYAGYSNHKGELLVQLKKALYGCIESAKLWYAHLRNSLEMIGFTINGLDECVFNKVFPSGYQCTVCVYVDDILVTSAHKGDVEATIKDLERVYKTVTVKHGPGINYLGMAISVKDDGFVEINMKGYIYEAIKHYGVTGTAKSPATNELFLLDEESPLLDTKGKEEFHSKVAKIMYLAKRARPDVLTACSFLSTRINEATEEDMRKIDRVFKYLNGTSELVTRLKATSDCFNIHCYVDASFGVHKDGKGHTGCILTLGGGPIYVRSAKQRLVAKSSSEAELIALSDEVSQAIWCKNFIEVQGYKCGPVAVYQDNKSTIAIAEKGKHTAHTTRHINIRYFFIKDRVESGEIKLIYKPTREMLADILTKPIQGQLLVKLRGMTLNIGGAQEFTLKDDFYKGEAKGQMAYVSRHDENGRPNPKPPFEVAK
jgi:hypothetical protein